MNRSASATRPRARRLVARTTMPLAVAGAVTVTLPSRGADRAGAVHDDPWV